MNSLPTRNGYGDALVELGAEKDNVYVVECDIAKSTKTDSFAKAYPERHLNVGIAEQNAAGVAAGLSLTNKIPFVSTYAVFGSMRMCEQVRTSICYPKLNVKIACSHGGVTPGNDGVTHQAIEDMGIYRTIPNMTVVMPADYNSAKELTKMAASYNGPMYLRFTRDAVPQIYGEQEKFEFGKAKAIREGKDIAIIAIGDMVFQALQAADKLAEQGIEAKVVDMFTLKPLDTKCVLDIIKKIGKIITVEDHNWINGLGSAVSDVAAEEGSAVIKRVGLQDVFAESGKYEELLEKYNMNSDYIVQKALTMF